VASSEDLVRAMIAQRSWIKEFHDDRTSDHDIAESTPMLQASHTLRPIRVGLAVTLFLETVYLLLANSGLGQLVVNIIVLLGIVVTGGTLAFITTTRRCQGFRDLPAFENSKMVAGSTRRTPLNTRSIDNFIPVPCKLGGSDSMASAPARHHGLGTSVGSAGGEAHASPASNHR
jgi:hypothetical protein